MFRKACIYDADMNHGPNHNSRPAVTRNAFSMLELLVVLAIVAILLAIILPALEKAQETARVAVCGHNLHQIGISISSYATENNSALPAGPVTPSTIAPARAWNTIGGANVWLRSTQQFNGVGVLTKAWIKDPRVFICPFEDDNNLSVTLLANLNTPSGDAYTSYAYRQLDQNSSDRLNAPGTNGKNQPVRALMLDWQSKGPAPFANSSHDQDEYLNVLYIDGHVQSFSDPFENFGADDSAYAAMPASYLNRLDQIWVTADYAEGSDPAKAPQLP
jgi:prepilin-type N-terminal cleavage/methylation domain-containing protein/prepilin-type processing-associated H-X9-DG protein